MIDNNQIWRNIPPEEKLEGLSKAHSRGVLTSFVVVLVGCSLAVGFRFSSLMWGAFLIAPLAFQITAGKAWRDLRPRLMLEYLAARSAARRYAFSVGAKELDMDLVFRASMILEQNVEDSPEASLRRRVDQGIDTVKEVTVWVALFKDAMVLMSEEPGGAKLQFSHLIDDKVEVTGQSEDEGDYTNGRELTIHATDKHWGSKNFKLRSRYPAALIVFEKVVQDRIKNFNSAPVIITDVAAALEAPDGEVDPFAAGGF